MTFLLLRRFYLLIFVQDDWQKRLKKAEVELGVIKHQKDQEILELKEQVRNRALSHLTQDHSADLKAQQVLQGPIDIYTCVAYFRFPMT